MEVNYNGYPVFKGLQRPLEFMGIRGRFLYYVAGAIAGAFFGYILCAIFVGQLVGFIVLVLVALGGYGASRVMQTHGMHSKPRSKDIYVVKTLFTRQ